MDDINHVLNVSTLISTLPFYMGNHFVYYPEQEEWILKCDGKCKLAFVVYDDWVRLNYFEVPEKCRRQGYATKFLKQLVQQCNEKKIDLTILTAKPITESIMDSIIKEFHLSDTYPVTKERYCDEGVDIDIFFLTTPQCTQLL